MNDATPTPEPRVIDAPPSAESAVELHGPRRRLTRGGTLLSALVLAAFTGWMIFSQLTHARVESVGGPEDALAVVVSRGMDLNEGLARLPAWERRLHQLVTSDGSDDLGQAIAWYDEIADRSLDPAVDAHLAVLYGEAGDRARVQRMTAGWQGRGAMLERLAPVVNTAYLGTADTDEEAERAALAEFLPDGWFGDRLALAWATRVGDEAVRAQAADGLETRGHGLVVRARALALGNAVLVVAGVAAAAVVWRHRRRPGALAVGEAALPPPWPFGVGMAVLIRGGAGGALVIVGLLFLAGAAGSFFDLEHPLLDMLTWPLMYVPVLVLAWRHLLSPAAVGFRDAFGLRLGPGGARHLSVVALAVLAAGAAVTTALTLGGQWLGLTSHWSEWFDAELAFGDGSAILANAVGSVVIAPLFEEAVFRGLLFATLRRALRAPAAIVLSGVIFGVAHGYGVVGFVDVASSGMLWAWAFERTGSILPGVVAHAATNLVVTVTLLALLR